MRAPASTAATDEPAVRAPMSVAGGPGVIVGVLLVGLTGWQRLDPVVAALVAVNILVTGFRLVSQSVTSLLDAALPAADVARVSAVLDERRTPEVDFAELRTRESGRHRFVALTVLVPGGWTVERGHFLADDVEKAVAEALPDTTVQTPLEPHRVPGPPRPTADAQARCAGARRVPGPAAGEVLLRKALWLRAAKVPGRRSPRTPTLGS